MKKPWFDRTYHGLYQNTIKLRELLDDGTDGSCVNLKVSREEHDWYTQPNEVTVDFERAVKLVKVAKDLQLLETIVRMILEELLEAVETAAVKEVLENYEWPRSKPFQ